MIRRDHHRSARAYARRTRPFVSADSGPTARCPAIEQVRSLPPGIALHAVSTSAALRRHRILGQTTVELIRLGHEDDTLVH